MSPRAIPPALEHALGRHERLKEVLDKLSAAGGYHSFFLFG